MHGGVNATKRALILNGTSVSLNWLWIHLLATQSGFPNLS